MKFAITSSNISDSQFSQTASIFNDASTTMSIQAERYDNTQPVSDSAEDEYVEKEQVDYEDAEPQKGTPSTQAVSSHTTVTQKTSTPRTAARSPQVLSAPPSSDDSSPRLDPHVDPFPMNGKWDPATLAAINIHFPTLNSRSETTNELTRSTAPEKRFWRGHISFSYLNFRSDVLRIEGVHIPLMQGPRYGTEYLYASCPRCIGDALANAGKSVRPTRIDEASLCPDSARWWKALDGVSNTFGSIDERTKRFFPRSLATIFEGTNRGVTVNLLARFVVKASTEDRSALRWDTAQSVSVEVICAYYVALDVDVQGPTKTKRSGPPRDAPATRNDVLDNDKYSCPPFPRFMVAYPSCCHLPSRHDIPGNICVAYKPHRVRDRHSNRIVSTLDRLPVATDRPWSFRTCGELSDLRESRTLSLTTEGES